MNKLDKDKVWHEVLESIKVSVSSAIFSTWLSKTHLSSLKKVGDNRYLAEIACSSFYVKATIQERYFGLIQDSLIKALGTPTDLSFVVKENNIATNKNNKLPQTPLFDEDDRNEELTNRLITANIRLGFNFENFAVSNSNQMAFAATEAVAASPGKTYNPLFLWGGVGVGKTHLMHAVGYKMIKHDMGSKVYTCSGEQFTNDIVQGIRNKTTQVFRDKYRKLEALFVDDIQFIAGKDSIQQEFFHTFNEVTAAGGQIILTSDKPPSEIDNIEERLRSRFEAGLIVDIAPPDFELRCAILQIKARERGMELPLDLVGIIAGNIDTARQIEGFLTRLSSESKLKNVPITKELIENILSKRQSAAKLEDKKISSNPDAVIDAVSKHFSVNKKVLLSHVRTRVVVRPRQILMYLLRTELGLPLQVVGRMIGGRDHSTVMHAVSTITQLASSNEKIREDLLGIKNIL